MSSKDEPHLTFTVSQKPQELPDSWKGFEPAYTSSGHTGDGKAYFYVYQGEAFDIVRFTNVADFYLWPNHIICDLLDPAYGFAIEIYLLGTVLSLWFERQGIVALHASAVVVKNQVVAFLASNTGGKSSLAATWMQAGYPLLTDDVLLVEQVDEQLVGRPGYPQMRMWPDQAKYFVGHTDLVSVTPQIEKLRVPVGPSGFGSFSNRKSPIVRMFTPVRRRTPEDSSIKAEPIVGAEALMELIKHSFIAEVVESLGWQSRRLRVLSQLVREVPLYRMHYPDGIEFLPQVRQAVLDDLAAVQL